MKYRITKELFLNSIRCSKAAYLQLNNPELEEETIDPLVLASAKEFESVACQLLAPEGIHVNDGLTSHEELAEITKRELKKTLSVLYQATFKTIDNEIAMADIFIKAEYRTALIEIKSGTGPITAETIYDVAYQHYVITKTGREIDEVIVVYANKDYVRKGEITDELLIVEDVTKKVKQLQSQIKALVERLQKIISRKTIPEKEIGIYCTDPRPCKFKDHCWGHLPTNNIFEIRNMRIGQKLKLFERGIIEFKDIPVQTKLTDNQWLQVSCELENKMILQPEQLNSWINFLEKGNGIYFMDFETVFSAVPMLDGTKPYTQVPFQYSLHYRDHKTKSVSHCEFLGDHKDEKDMRLTFLESLLAKLSDIEAPIVTWNMHFEKSRLNELSKLYPQYSDSINKINKNIVDLMVIFKDKIFYDPRFKGSYSIKNILPVICPELNYDNLIIGNGSMAAYEFSRLKSASVTENKMIREALLKYCERDTFAMVKILEFLESTIISINN